MDRDKLEEEFDIDLDIIDELSDDDIPEILTYDDLKSLL